MLLTEKNKDLISQTQLCSHLAGFLIPSRLGVGLAWAGHVRSIDYKGPWLSTGLNSKNYKGSRINSTVAVIYSIG